MRSSVDPEGTALEPGGVSPTPTDVSQQHVAGAAVELFHLLIRETGRGSGRQVTRLEEDFTLEHVADSGGDPLVEKEIGDGPAGAAATRAGALDDVPEVDVFGQKVGSEPSERAMQSKTASWNDVHLACIEADENLVLCFQRE